ncbi:MAG: hypothetical protein S0880_26600 [Actinomycetota bacterium]|nr:hypothetical protein [Actinomycetota bacterium]
MTRPPSLRRRRVGRVVLSCALLVVSTGSVTLLGARGKSPGVGRGYISALRAADVYGEFGALDPAVDNARAVCSGLDAGKPAQGDRADRIGVEHFCPDHAEDFDVTADVELDGRLTLFDAGYAGLGDDRPCTGRADAVDLRPGAPVVLASADGRVIDRATLSDGRSWGSSCIFGFTLRLRDDADRFRLRIGGREAIEMGRSELVTPQGPVFLVGST